jgi:acetoacetyl-CoA synthetase
MTTIQEGDLLWRPTPAIIENANMTEYMHWLAEKKGKIFDGYRPLWEWSVEKTADFWQSLWQYFDITASEEPDEILADDTMPGARWFSGARLNYAENFFSRMNRDKVALLYKAEDEPLKSIRWGEIYNQTNHLAQILRDMGVREGDRVVAYLPNIPEAIVGLFACASLGAVWSSSSPDFGSRSVLDRFQQIEPKVLLAVDGYVYNGKPFDRLQVVAELQAGLPTLERTILVPLLSAKPDMSGLEKTGLWSDMLDTAAPPPKMTFAQLPFDHPLWVL